MHLLITNDDGYFSPGISILARHALESGHEVTLCAPLYEQSAQSHRMTLSSPLMTREIQMDGVRAFAVDGSPVDCVRVAPYLAEKPFDFCLSGINKGDNVGSAIYYSGTNGAAREAAMNYLPAIAVSVERGGGEEHFRLAADKALEMLDYLKNRPMPRMTFCNLNIPGCPLDEIKPMKMAGISSAFFLDKYDMRTSPRRQPYFWTDTELKLEEPEPGSDLYELRRGHITCTFVGGFQDRNAVYPDLCK